MAKHNVNITLPTTFRGIRSQSAERYYFHSILLVSKGNCARVYLCKKVICELDR